MRRCTPHTIHTFLGLTLAVAGCAADAPASDATCNTQGLSSVFEAGSAMGDAEDASARPEVASEEEGACALAGLKQGLSKRRRHGHGGHGGHDQQKQCKNDGKVVGQTAGALFCDLSIALGGLGEDELLIPGPESACSRAFEAACRRNFDRAIADYAATIGDPSADCTQFAQGEFQRAYEIARHNQCLFSVGTEPPPPDDCSDGKCECREQQSCELDCQDEACEASCEHAETCEIDAGGGEASCRHVARCDADMNGPGKLLCEHAGSCDLTCIGPECDVICRHVGKCKARIDEGSVRCEHTGKCQVECANGKKARRTRDGRFVCDGRRDGDSCLPGHKR